MAAAHIDMTSQPAGKQDGERLADNSSQPLPGFSDSLAAAAKRAEPEHAASDSDKVVRRTKTAEDDAGPVQSAHEQSATLVVAIPMPVPVPQDLLPVSAGDGNAVTLRGDSMAPVDRGADSVASAAGAAASSSGSSVVESVGAGDGKSAIRAAALPVDPASDGDTKSVGTKVSKDVTNATAGLRAEAGASVVKSPGVPASAASVDDAPHAAVADGGPPNPTGTHAGVRAAVSEAPASVFVAPMPVTAACAGDAPATGEVASGLSQAGADSKAAHPNDSGSSANVPAMGVEPRAALMKVASRAVASGQTESQIRLSKTTAGLPARAKAGSKSDLKDGGGAKAVEKVTDTFAEVTDSGLAEKTQRDNAMPAQDVAVAVAPANHHAVAEFQAQGAAVSMTPSQAPNVSDSGHGAVRSNDFATPEAAAVAQPSVAIHTAKLIESMGQTEMRVGMRSMEFGNISIRTSSTPELVSAQISVDHGELARMLVAHVPEMQARLGGGQPVHVQIDRSGQDAGAGGGTNGSAQDGRGSKQGQMGFGSRSSNAVGVQAYVGGGYPLAFVNDAPGTRLDVRV